MTTTPTSGAADLPEALRSIQRFEVVDCIDDKHVPAVVPKLHGPWVRYEDHIAALAAGQATAAQQGAAYAELEKKHADFVETVGLMLAAIGYKEDYARQWPKEKASVTFRRWFDEQRASHGQAQADSVQEDAARLDWLEQNLFHREMDEWDVKFGGRGDQNMWVLFAPKGVQGSARRIIDAARKQGASQ